MLQLSFRLPRVVLKSLLAQIIIRKQPVKLKRDLRNSSCLILMRNYPNKPNRIIGMLDREGILDRYRSVLAEEVSEKSLEGKLME